MVGGTDDGIRERCRAGVSRESWLWVWGWGGGGGGGGDLL